jgi:hypothetical protein
MNENKVFLLFLKKLSVAEPVSILWQKEICLQQLVVSGCPACEIMTNSDIIQKAQG